jgi:serine/threonine protein kinase
VLLGAAYTRAIDIWSLGCIAAELFLGLALLPGSSECKRVVTCTRLPDHAQTIK